MPEVFKLYGYSFFFYSREHEPIHIHVEGNGGYAIYDLVNDKFDLREKHGIKVSDLKRIETAISDNKDLIVKKWKEHFEN